MKLKLSFLAAALWAAGCIGEAYTAVPSQNSFHFYAGLSGGIEHMSGKRIDSLDEENILHPPDRLDTTYSDKGMSGDNISLSILGGFLWKVPSAPILLGPELYFGRGTVNSLVKVFGVDPFGAGNQRIYYADFYRKYFAGALLRAGYQFCQSYLAHVGIGFDSSQFSRKTNVDIFPLDAQVPAFINNTQKFNGLVLGIGLERAFHQFIVGLDLRMIQYQKKMMRDAVTIPPATGPTAFVMLNVRPRIYSAALRFCYRF